MKNEDTRTFQLHSANENAKAIGDEYQLFPLWISRSVNPLVLHSANETQSIISTDPRVSDDISESHLRPLSQLATDEEKQEAIAKNKMAQRGTMKISINRTHKNKMPEPLPADWWSRFNGSFENEDCDAADVLMYARYGWSYCSQHRNYRKADNFICGQHLDLDFDDGKTTMETLLADDFIRNFAAFIYTTASHTPAAPRLRVFFQLDRPIYSAEKYRLLRDSLMARYPAADRAHVDVCRFAFGSVDCDYHYWGNVLTLEDAADLLVIPYRQSMRQARANIERETAVNRLPATQNLVSGQYLTGKRDFLLNKVENAPEGEKYHTLRSVAVTLGGYVASGYYDESQTRYALQEAIRSNPNNVKNLETADHCIDAGLSFGMSRPLTVDGSQYRTLGHGRI